MPSRHAMTVSLTPELARLVAAGVASGAYGSASEVVRALSAFADITPWDRRRRWLRLLFAGGLETPDAPARDAPRRVGLRATRAAKEGPDRG